MAISPRPSIPTTRSLDVRFKTNLDKVTAHFALHTPLKGVTYHSKPWWSVLLSVLRKACNSALQSSKGDHFDGSLL